MTHILVNSSNNDIYNYLTTIDLDDYDTDYNDDEEEEKSWLINYNDEGYYIFENEFSILTEEEYQQELKKIKDVKKNIFYKKSQVEPLVKSIFGERAYCQGAEDNYNFIIHFPIINIKNRDGRTHVITDLYFKTEVNFLGASGINKISINVKGGRGSATVSEIYSAYGHSHLSNGLNACSFSSFCLGASDFKVLIANLQMNPEEYLWEMYLYSIEAYLSWESLDGGPYNRIEKIRSPQNSSSIIEAIRIESVRLAKLIPEESFNFINGLVLQSDSSLERFYEENSNIKSESSSNVDTDRYKNHESLSFNFEKRVYFKVIKDKEENNKFDKNLIIRYNNFINTYINDFSKKLKYEYAIKNSKFKHSEIRIS
jgi:hypothetical protein